MPAQSLRFPLILLAILAQGVAGEDRAPPGKFFGGIWQLGSRNQYFGSLFDQMTPENAGKWQSVQGGPGAAWWRSIDQILDLQRACSEHMPVSLRWHLFLSGDKYSPAWVPRANDPRQATSDWLDTMLGKVGPAGFDWIDTVSEPLHFPPSWREHLGGAGETGYDWIVWAFAQARARAPTAKLLLDEYDVFKKPVIRAEYLKIAAILKERGLIDGLGEEALFLERMPGATLKLRLDELATLGLPIYITQYACNIADDQQQLAIVQDHLRTFYEHPAVVGVNHWSFIEGRTWSMIPNGYLIRKDGSERPALSWLRSYLGRHRPPRPDGLTLAPISHTSITVSWAGTGTLATGYRVERQTGPTWRTLATSATCAATVNGLDQATLHRLRVVTTNAHGDSVASEPAEFDNRGPLFLDLPGAQIVLAGGPLGLGTRILGAGADTRWEWCSFGGDVWTPLAEAGPEPVLTAEAGRSGWYRCRSGGGCSASVAVEIYSPGQVVLERAGVAVAEAESAEVVPGVEPGRWQRQTDAEAGGGACLQMDNALAVTIDWQDGAEARWPVRIDTAGAYRLAIRANITGSENDKVWWMMDHQPPRKWTGKATQGWAWLTGTGDVTLEPGLHVLRIRRMRPDWNMDRVALLAAGTPDLTGNVPGPEPRLP